MRIPLLLAVVLMVLPVGARAQLSVRLIVERDTFLVYESVPVQVVIQNSSGRTLQLAGGSEKPWLDFIIKDDAGRITAATSTPVPGQAMGIGPGQVAARTVDLVPHYELRSQGNYTVQAYVEAGPLKALSQPVRLTIVNGREIWTQKVGLPVAEGKEEAYREYSVLLRRGDRYDQVYVGVRDESKGLVYGMLPLGIYISMGEPDCRTDKDGHLHLLYRNSSQSFGYVNVDPNGNIVDRAAYTAVQSQPVLATAKEGTVSVVGGEKVFPRTARAKAEPLPPPEPPPKKKGLWPFGKRERGADSTVETNAPAQNFGPR